MNQLSTERRAQVVRSLIEGNSIRSTVRITGAAKNTVTKLLVETGAACLVYHDDIMRNLPCRRLQCDEIWSFCYSKEKRIPEKHQGEFGYGDVWTWTAIDAQTKLVPSFHVGRRTASDARMFTNDLAGRLANRVQLTTDGMRLYMWAVEEAFGYADVDYAQLIKIYGDSDEETGRYSPADCTGCERRVVFGEPDPDHISTSFAERQNLTMRMSMRRFTRLTNAFSKKVENLICAVSLHFLWYNFGRVHMTLSKGTYPTTPAMKVGLADHPWTVEEVIELL